jgi:hypothetical protein
VFIRLASEPELAGIDICIERAAECEVLPDFSQPGNVER